jgi:hypothetical protein
VEQSERVEDSQDEEQEPDFEGLPDLRGISLEDLCCRCCSVLEVRHFRFRLRSSGQLKMLLVMQLDQEKNSSSSHLM